MARPKILVVDDVQSTVSVMVEALRGAGFGADGITDSVAAAVAVRSGTYDLVISDIMMPELLGTALLKLAKEASPHTQVILVTGFAKEVQIRRLLERGAFAVLQKPFMVDDLVARVREALKLGGERRGVERRGRKGRERRRLSGEGEASGG